MRDYIVKKYTLSIDFLDYSKTNRSVSIPVNDGYLPFDISKMSKDIIYNEKDTNTAFIEAQLLADGSAIDLNGYDRVVVGIKKNDGLRVHNDCTILDATKGKIEIPFTSQSLAAVGINYFDITLYKGHSELVSPKFSYRVMEAMVDDDSLESSNEFGTLVLLIEKTDELLNRTNEACDRVLTLEELMIESERVRNENEETRKSNEVNRGSEFNNLKTEMNTLKNNWDSELNTLYIDKSTILDNLKTTKENELNKLHAGKDSELSTLYNSKNEELSSLSYNWNADFNSLYTSKNDILDNLKTSSENKLTTLYNLKNEELSRLQSDKDNMLTTLYNSKNEELSTLKNKWNTDFQNKYDGLNEEYSGRVVDLEEDILDANYSEDLLNENVLSFKVGTGTVNGTPKDYTEQMEQSIITLDNIQGKTSPRLSDSQIPSIRLTEIGIPVSSDESVYKFDLPTDASAYTQGSLSAWDAPWEQEQTPAMQNRIRVVTPLKIPAGARYMYVRNRNLMYYFSIIGCKKGATDSTTSDRTRDDLGWMAEDMYTGKIIEIPSDWNSIGFSVRKKVDTAMVTPAGDAPHLKGSIYFFKDISRISKEDLFLCSLPGNKIYDELKDGVLRKRVTRFNTADGNWKTTDFTTVTGKDGKQYGRLTIQVPNIFVSSLEHVDCGNVEVIDYATNKAEWDTPSKNTLIINISAVKSRIAFTLESRMTQARAEEAILKDNPRIITAQMQNAEAIDINPSIRVNKNDLVFVCSPLELTCTHKVQLNSKGQVEELQQVVQREKKSVWQKVKNVIDIRYNFSENGYFMFPAVFGGLIIQWGKANLDFNNQNRANKMVTYPIMYKHTVYAVQTTITSSPDFYAIAGYPTRVNEFQAWACHSNSASFTGGQQLSWFSIGR